MNSTQPIEPRPSKPGTAAAGDPLRAALARLETGRMDIHSMLSELRAHAAALDELIQAAERFARGEGKRRGRPPKWMNEGKKRGRPPGSKNRGKETAAAS